MPPTTSRSNKRILIVATYPIANAQHGGQKRCAAIFDEYQKRFKEVRFAAVFHRDFYPKAGPYDVTLSPRSEAEVQKAWYLGDVVCGQAIYDDPKVKNHFVQLLTTYKPDIIEIEQVFPYMGLKKLLDELGLNPQIVASSHNIEYAMKLELLNSMGQLNGETKAAVELIKDAEEQLARQAAVSSAVTASDAKVLEGLGAGEVIVAPNGIERQAFSPADAHYWQQFKDSYHLKNLILFVASAHPPNWIGLEKMTGKALGFIPFDAKLVIAGSLSDYLQEHYGADNLEELTFWQRAYPAGRLKDTRLAALLDAADVIILPLTEGGGSNLKTAEALLADKKIVATNYAFRSFEKYQDFPNIWLADKPSAFRKAILQALAAKRQPRSQQQADQAELVRWPYCLNDFVERVTAL